MLSRIIEENLFFLNIVPSLCRCDIVWLPEKYRGSTRDKRGIRSITSASHPPPPLLCVNSISLAAPL